MVLRADVAALVRANGSPAFVYDLARIRENVGRFRAALPGVWLAYAVKANPHQAVVSALRDLVDAFDVSSAGELEQCAGAEMVFSGPAKKPAAIRRAAELGARITAEAVDQYTQIREHAPNARVAVRVNPSARIHAYRVPMGGVASAFGIDEDQLDEVAPFDGIQVFAGSQVSSPGGVVKAACAALDLAERFDTVDWVSFGGGLVPGFDVEALGTKLGSVLDKFRSATGRTLACGFELGRYVVQDAGFYVAQVVSTKTSQGERFAVLDGGFNHLMLHMGRNGVAAPVRNVTNADGPKTNVNLAGPLCTPLDRFAEVTIAEPRPGDLLLFENVGAYGLTASPSAFIGHEKPAEVILDGPTERRGTTSRT